MALDEALLESVAGGADTAYLRTYGWTIPTLEPRLLSASGRGSGRSALSIVALVRRLTGGGAIWHHHEVTYALVVPAVIRWLVPARSSIGRCTRHRRHPGRFGVHAGTAG